VPREPVRPAPLVGKVFRGTTVVRQGLLTSKQLRSSPWRRLRQDVYVDARVPVTHRLMISAVGLVLPEGAGFGGLSAAVLWEVADVAGLEDPVEVLLPPGCRWNAGEGVRCRRASGRALVRRGRWLCSSRMDTAVDIARFASGDEAVVLLDHLVREGLIELAALRADLADREPCRGLARARRAAHLADGLAGSQQETRLRLLLLRGGLPPPVAQYVVRDDGGFAGRVDFAYPDLRLAIEYDGLYHAGTRTFFADRRRLDRLTAAGWTVIHVTAEDMRNPERLLARIRAARARLLAAAGTR
jgi:hypothetical protein